MGRWPRFNVVATVGVNCALGVQAVGYQLTLLYGPRTLVQDFLGHAYRTVYPQAMEEDLQNLWLLILALLPLGAVMGSVVSPLLMWRVGRKRSLVLVGNSLLLIGSILCAFSPRWDSYYYFAAGRFITGVSLGIMLSTVPVMVGETAEARFSAPLSCLVFSSLALGSLISLVLGRAEYLGRDKSWPYLFLIPTIGSVMHFTVYPLFPESPIYLLMRRKIAYVGEEEMAESVFFYEGSGRNPLTSVKRMEGELERHSVFSSSHALRARSKALALTALVPLAHNAAGMWAVTDALSSTQNGYGGDWVWIGMFGTAALCTIPAMVLVVTTRRRPLLIVTTALLTAANFALVSVVAMDELGYALMPGVLIITGLVMVGAWSVGPGPLAFLLPIELVPPQLAHVASSVAATAYFGGLTLARVGYEWLRVDWGSYVFLLFATPSLLILALLLCLLPEPKEEERADFSYGTFHNPSSSL